MFKSMEDEELIEKLEKLELKQKRGKNNDF